jgi:hypothetical protein
VDRIWDDRLAEVWAAPGNAGAGVVIDAKTVLTARHVVVGAPKGGGVLVRVVRPGMATAAWVPMLVLAQDPAWDVAVLVVDHESEASGTPGWRNPSSRLVFAGLGTAIEPRCEAVGFPGSEVQRTSQGAPADVVRQSKQASGTLAPAGQAKQPQNADRALPRRWMPLDVDGATPETPGGWGGMSGAGVVLPDGRLVGIVVAAEADHQLGRLYMVPLAEVLAQSLPVAAALSAVLGHDVIAQAREAKLYSDILEGGCLGADGLPTQVADAGLAAFGVKPAGLPDEPEFLDYVPRDGDHELRESMQQAHAERRMLLVVGGSAAGKSRSAAEAARLILGECRLLCPKQTSLARLAELPVADLNSVLVWLDDAERYNGRAFRDIVDWLLQLGAMVVATIRRTALEAKMPSGDLHDPLGDALGDENLVVQVAWDVTWKKQELARVSQHVSYEPLLEWVAAGNSLSAWIVAGPALERRLLVAHDDDERPVRYALVRTVLDWYRTGISQPCPRETVGKLLQTHLSAKPDDVKKAFDWALESVIGASRQTEQALLSEHPGGAITVHDYIQDADAQSSEDMVPDIVWQAALKHANTARALFSVGMTAGLRENIDIASKAFLPLAKAGDVDAMTILGTLLLDSNPKQALRWWKKSAKTGYSDAMFKITALYGRRYPSQARRLLENAARAGNVDAKYNLAVLLHDSDPEEAARWEDEWGHSGHETLHTFLGMIMQKEAAEAAQQHRMSEE